MGTAAACAISKLSPGKILLIDRYGIGNDYCSSNDVNRVFSYAYGNDEFYTRMAVESLKLWQALEKESGRQLLIPTGLLMLHGNDANSNKFAESSYKTLNRLRLGAKTYEEHDLKKQFPQFQAERAFHDLHGGVLLASKILKTFTSQLKKRGVQITEKHATKIEKNKSIEIKTADGQSISAKKLIVTVGPWTNDFLHDNLVRIKPTRQQVIYLQPKQDLEKFRPEKCPVFFTDYHYGLPATEIDAVKISNKQLNDPVDPETANRTVDREQIEQCRAACRKFVPGLADGKLVKSKVCLYDMTENSDFVIDRDPENPDIVYGYGFSGHGFKFAPFIGSLLAELTLEIEPSFDLSRLSIKNNNRTVQLTQGHLGKGE